MGEGEIPKIMQVWAQNECARLGLGEKLADLQKEHLRALETRLRNTIGDDTVNRLTNQIKQFADKLKGQ